MKINLRFGTGALLALALLLCLAFVPAACTQENKDIALTIENSDFSVEKEYGELFFESMGHSTDLTSPVPLKNLEGEVEVVAFSMDKGGYIVINVNDLSVPEFSMECESPFLDKSIAYYNGPLAYVETKEMKNRINETTYIYKKEKVNKSKKILELQEATTDALNKQVLSYTSDSLSHSLRRWEDSNIYCGPMAAGIILIYLDDYLDDDFVASSYENRDDLLGLIINSYINNMGVTSVEIRNGLNSYISDRNLDSEYSSYASSFDYTKLMSLISDDKPVDIHLVNHPSYAAHAVIAHGYYILTTPYVNPQYYVVVNNGYGDNNINILVDSYIERQVWIE